MENQSPHTTYSSYVDNLHNTLKESHTYDQVMELAVGGSFEVVGILERELLIQHGLRSHDYLIDVGCGSGRLAKPLADYLQGPYLGIDIVPALVDYARELVNRSDWRFEVAQGLTIPEKDNQADMVCFFSVFTHLRHEETYQYLQEARRVLKPDGKIIFSFLEFPNPHHWSVFEHNVASHSPNKPLDQFVSLDAIKIWAYHLDMQVTTLSKAGKIRLPREFHVTDGTVLNGTVLLGQSVGVLSKTIQPRWKRKVNNGLFRAADWLQRLHV